jgi:hypothetical protein
MADLARTAILLNDAGSIVICTIPGEEFPVLCRVESSPAGTMRYQAVARFINDDEAEYMRAWLEALSVEES